MLTVILFYLPFQFLDLNFCTYFLKDGRSFFFINFSKGQKQKQKNKNKRALCYRKMGLGGVCIAIECV